MVTRKFDLGDKALELSVYSDSVVRFRISREFKQTYLERYKILSEPDEGVGSLIDNGVEAGELRVTFDGGILKFETPKAVREISFDNSALEAKNKYFDEKLNGFRPVRKQIIGDETKDEIAYVDFVKDPKYMTVKTQGETFYGLGESNVDRLTLNGKTYLQRVIYTKSEISIPFLMTKAGYGLLSTATIWHGVDVCDNDANEIVWYLPDDDIDFFIFSGDSLRKILERYTYIAGRPMCLPKWAYGLTFIDQDRADQFEVMRDAATFRQKKIPCDSISLEPGWMAKRYDFSTEKNWNIDRYYICEWMRYRGEEYNPDSPHPRMFTAALRRYGFKTMLWLCCRYDFTANEENMAGNPKDFGMEPWFKHLRMFVNDGVSGFKMDPCKLIDTSTEDRVYANGEPEAKMHSLQTTLYGKEMNRGYSEYTKLRPMHHLSGGSTGSQRFAAATTGDSGGRYKTLVWMLNSGLTGFSNITCDMDIFAKHTVHFCFFTAWCELDTWSGYSHPWWAGEEQEELFTFYDKLRYRLMPYVYSNAIDAHLSGTPMMRAMPLMYEDSELADATCEYMFGENLLIGAFSDTIYLPTGETWIDFWSGKAYAGGQTLTPEIPEDRGGPLYVRGGAVIPTQVEKQFTDCKDDARLILDLFPVNGVKRVSVLHEDDGRTLSEDRADTLFTLGCNDNVITLDIGKREGSFAGMNDKREYTLRVFAPFAVSKVCVDGVPAEFTVDGQYTVIDAGEGRNVTIE